LGEQNFGTGDLVPMGQQKDKQVLWWDGVDVSETEAIL
jgi:hypothetical protein